MLHHRPPLAATHVLPETVLQLSFLKITIVTGYFIQVLPFLKSDEREKLQVPQNPTDLLAPAKEKNIMHY